MSFSPSEPSNPFEAPKTRIGEAATHLDGNEGGEAQEIREKHIYHESSVKSLGALHYLGAALFLIVTVGVFGAVATDSIPVNRRDMPNLPPETMKYVFIVVGVFYCFMTALSAALGFGLRRLQVWSRWTVLVLSCLFLLYAIGMGLFWLIVNSTMGLIFLGFGTLIPGYIIYLMASSKSGTIFSPEYRRIILQTPHVKPRTSAAAKIVLGLVVAIILLSVVLSR